MKVLFLGLGGVGQRHLRNLLRIVPDADIGAVRHANRSFEIGYDIRPDYAVDIMKKYEITRLTDLDEAAAWGPDLAIISSPTSAHLRQAAAMVEAGVPVFLEKPVGDAASGEAGLNELAALASERNVPVMVGYMFRFHPGVRRFLELAKARALGPVHTAHVQLNSYMPAWHGYEKYNEFYAGRKDLGGGAVLSEIHEVDLLAALFGFPDSVAALGGTLSGLDMDVEDTACALLGYRENGRLLPVTLQMSFVQRPNTRTITLYCERGTLAWDAVAGTVTVRDEESGANAVEDFSDFERNEMFVEELRHFLKCLESGEKPESALESVLDGHRLALAILDALQTQ